MKNMTQHDALESIEVIHVIPLKDYRLQLKFSTGEIKTFDVSPYLDKGIFRELRDVSYFKSVGLDYGTVVWSHKQDFSPVTLYTQSI